WIEIVSMRVGTLSAARHRLLSGGRDAASLCHLDSRPAQLGGLRKAGRQIYVKLNGSSNYVYITRHKLLKNRHLRAAVMRPYTSQYPKFGSGVVLFLHASPREARRRPELTRVAAWPAFWLVVYARSDGREVYSCQSCEVLPGGLRELSDGALVLLSKHESLRHMLLSIYPVSPEGCLTVPPISEEEKQHYLSVGPVPLQGE
ncbi:unnamed protein product, partial [Prorocentrum cordatum]